MMTIILLMVEMLMSVYMNIVEQKWKTKTQGKENMQLPG